MTLLLHPGFHKTATSWLQSVVFAEHRLFRSLLDHQEIDDVFVRPHDLDFDPDEARVTISKLRQGTKSAAVDVISSEILSGTMFSGSRESLRLADRLSDVFDDAKILLTVRSQQSIMKSVYLQYLKRGGRLSIEDYIDYRPEAGYFWFEPKVLEFDRLAQAYADRFGSENVLVLPQELLRTGKAQYLSLLFRFAGVATKASEPIEFGSERGVSPPASGIPLLRFANIFQRSPLNPEAVDAMHLLNTGMHRLAYRWKFRESKAEAQLRAAIESRLSGLYGPANQQLQKYSPVDLGGLGYEMAD